ncbi:MAG: hypothetical protein O2971_05870 [Proteobacteria bacterium]|nr:hypothetical protein [Pseudomonadota bacterium]
MSNLKFISHAILWALTGSLKLCWSLLVLFIDIVDGGDADYSSTDYVNYDHRTGDLDPIERCDSLYDNQW